MIGRERESEIGRLGESKRGGERERERDRGIEGNKSTKRHILNN